MQKVNSKWIYSHGIPHSPPCGKDLFTWYWHTTNQSTELFKTYELKVKHSIKLIRAWKYHRSVRLFISQYHRHRVSDIMDGIHVRLLRVKWNVDIQFKIQREFSASGNHRVGGWKAHKMKKNPMKNVENLRKHSYFGSIQIFELKSLLSTAHGVL